MVKNRQNQLRRLLLYPPELRALNGLPGFRYDGFVRLIV